MYILNTNLINTMKKLFLLVVLLISMGTGIWAQFPKAIFPGDYPDPSILRDGKDYYMTHSPFVMLPDCLSGIPLICCIGSRSAEHCLNMRLRFGHPTC